MPFAEQITAINTKVTELKTIITQFNNDPTNFPQHVTILTCSIIMKQLDQFVGSLSDTQEYEAFTLKHNEVTALITLAEELIEQLQPTTEPSTIPKPKLHI
jgi:isocitrate dehydrogenase kinase/phosphatase